MITDFLKLAFENLRKRGLRSWLTMIGIFIGIAAVVSLIGLGEGLRTAINAQFGFLGPDVLSVQASGVTYGPPGQGAVNPLSDEIVDEIRKVGGVEVAFNRYIATVKMEYNDVQIVTSAISVPEGDNRKVLERMMNVKSEEGRLLKDGDTRKIVLGNSFAEADNQFDRSVRVGDSILLNDIGYDVVGVMESKGSFLFDNAVLVNEPELLNSLRDDDGTTDIIAIKAKNINDIPAIKKDVEKLLRKERDVDEGEEDFIVESPQQTLESLNSTLFAVQLFVYIIATISLLVGGIGIMNTMYTAVVERTKEIGIMKSIGARNSTIFTIFLIESGFLGTVGGIIGITLGVSFAYGLAFIGKIALGSELIQAHVGLWLILGSLVFAFVLGTFFGVMPAYQASKLQPVESIRSAK
ncbi:FtsX-like permease family protein [Candidatus Woesearchaeota archaeon]|nr:FtsX-like permease family protein [Candidatus Woesearchaeota archaeon]